MFFRSSPPPMPPTARGPGRHPVCFYQATGFMGSRRRAAGTAGARFSVSAPMAPALLTCMILTIARPHTPENMKDTPALYQVPSSTGPRSPITPGPTAMCSPSTRTAVALRASINSLTMTETTPVVVWFCPATPFTGRAVPDTCSPSTPMARVLPFCTPLPGPAAATGLTRGTG